MKCRLTSQRSRLSLVPKILSASSKCVSNYIVSAKTNGKNAASATANWCVTRSKNALGSSCVRRRRLSPWLTFTLTSCASWPRCRAQRRPCAGVRRISVKRLRAFLTNLQQDSTLLSNANSFRQPSKQQGLSTRLRKTTQKSLSGLRSSRMLKKSLLMRSIQTRLLTLMATSEHQTMTKMVSDNVRRRAILTLNN